MLMFAIPVKIPFSFSPPALHWCKSNTLIRYGNIGLAKMKCTEVTGHSSAREREANMDQSVATVTDDMLRLQRYQTHPPSRFLDDDASVADDRQLCRCEGARAQCRVSSSITSSRKASNPRAVNLLQNENPKEDIQDGTENLI